MNTSKSNKSEQSDQTQLKIYYVISPKELKSFWIIAPSEEITIKIVEAYELITESSPEIHCFSDFVLTELSNAFDFLSGRFTKEIEKDIRSYKKEITQNNYDIYQKYQNLPANLAHYLDQQDRDAATLLFHILDSTNASGRIILQQMPITQKKEIPFLVVFTPILNPLNTNIFIFNEGEAFVNTLNNFIDKIKDHNRTIILNSVKMSIHKLEDITTKYKDIHNDDAVPNDNDYDDDDDYGSLPF